MNNEIGKRLKKKEKVDREAEAVQPGVINDSIIKKYIIDYNKENKIFDRDDMPVWELSHLAISYKNIVEIDNLKGLTNLTKL